MSIIERGDSPLNPPEAIAVPGPLCQRCGRRKAGRPRRNPILCWTCYYATQCQSKDEPTQAQLEATIAEQSRKLPPWWDRETSRARRDNPFEAIAKAFRTPAAKGGGQW